jgi:acetyl-CoA C-acetyltransferase
MGARRVPVIVGVAQLRRRPELDGPFEPVEPVQMMVDVVRRASGDAGDPALYEKADYLGTVSPIGWPYADTPARLAELLGTSPALRHEPKPGGNSPLDLVNHAASAIARGETHVAILAGGEAIHARQQAAREGIALDHWSPQPDPPVDVVMRGQPPMTSPLEARHGIRLPTDIFPLFENALRARAGRSIGEHQAYLGRMMARFSSVAAKNPYAWFPRERSAEEFTTVSASNRWICFPYPKLMNAIIAVDMAAALVLMSDEEADRRGIPPARRVAFLAGASAHDPWTPTERREFSRSPGCAAAARSALEHAGLGIDDVDLFDLYSCFPSAVQLGLAALGLEADDPRPLTVTGGLACAGGPGNEYCMHAVAALAERLRAGDGAVGLVSGLGMSASKHSINLFSTDSARIAAADGEAPHVQPPAEDLVGPGRVDAPEGPGRIETYTVAFDRDGGPQTSRLIVRLDDGRRTVAHGEARPAAFARLIESEGVGLRGRVQPGGDGEPNRFELD